MKQYLDLLRKIKDEGYYSPPARENMPGTLSLFGEQMRFDLSEKFPLATTKKVSFKNIVVELLFFLRGDTNIKYLVDRGCNIWNSDGYGYYLKKCKEQNLDRTISFELFVDYIKNAKNLHELTLDSLKNQMNDCPLIPKNYVLGDLGMQYGKLWRDIEGIDQIKELISGLKNNPFSRRHIVSAWNVPTLNDMALNACHTLYQFNCRLLTYEERIKIWIEKRSPDQDIIDDIEENNTKVEIDSYNLNIPKYHLDCQLYQRSCDYFLGASYNIASYALLTILIAKICNMIPGKFIHTLGNLHLYENHLTQAEEQLKRTPTELPTLEFSENLNNLIKKFNEDDKLDDFINAIVPEDFILKNYNPQPAIKAELSTGLKK